MTEPTRRVQIIQSADGEPEYAVLPYDEWKRLTDAAAALQGGEDAADRRTLDAAISAAVGEERVPGDVVKRLVGGDNPLRVWREHRGLTQAALAAAGGIDQGYLSQIEAGKRDASLKVLRSLAAALGTDIDQLAG